MPERRVGVKGYVPPPAPVASAPSQRSAEPVIVLQNEAHVEPVTPLNVIEEVAVSVPVVSCPMVEDEMSAPFICKIEEVACAKAPQEVEGVKGYEPPPAPKPREAPVTHELSVPSVVRMSPLVTPEPTWIERKGSPKAPKVCLCSGIAL
jgi:hypothetical protein